VIGRQLERRRLDVCTNHEQSVPAGRMSFNAAAKFQTDRHAMA
jgi:hypothetical protein